MPMESERPKLRLLFGDVGVCIDVLECLRGLESLPYERGVAKERSMFEGCLLCLGVLGDEGILKLCVKE